MGDCFFERPDVGMRLCGDRVGRTVGEAAHAGNFSLPAAGCEDDLVGGVAPEGRGEVLELRREIVVEKKKAHRSSGRPTLPIVEKSGF